MMVSCGCGRYVDRDGVCAGWNCALRAVEEPGVLNWSWVRGGVAGHGLGLLIRGCWGGREFGYFWSSRAELATLWWYIGNRELLQISPHKQAMRPRSYLHGF